MPSYDEHTSRGWPLPHPDNDLEHDVERLRAALKAINSELDAIEERAKVITEEHIAPLEDRQAHLDTRLDVIAGQSTEDTEILDARVDAKNTVHPNLGHNVRSLHSEILELDEAIKYGVKEFQGLLRQFTELAEAQIQGELNSREAYERRKQELQYEAQTRSDADESLQRQASNLANAELRQSLNLKNEIEHRRNEIQRTDERVDTEREERVAGDTELSRKAEENFADVRRDISLLRADDEVLQEQASELVQAQLQAELNLHEASEERRAELSQEASTRKTEDEALQESVDKLSSASLQHSLNLQSEIEQRRKVHDEEAQARTEQREVLQSEIDDLSNAALRQDLNMRREAQTRREELSQTQRQIQEQDERSGYQQQDINSLIEAVVHNALIIQRALNRRREALRAEEEIRYGQVEELQGQTQELSEASLNNVLNIHQEAEERRRELAGVQHQLEGLLSGEDYVQSQILNLITAIFQSNVNLHNAVKRFRAALTLEAQERLANDRVQQPQIDDATISGLNNALNIHQEAQARRKEFLQTRGQLEVQQEQSSTQQSEIGSLIDAVLQSSINLHEAVEHRRIALNQETQERIEDDEALQAQIDRLVQAVVQNAINFHEALERQSKTINWIEDDETLQEQINQNSTAILQGSLNLHDALAQRRDALGIETSIRSEDDAQLQTQTDTNAQADMHLALSIAHEAQRRRALEYVVSQIKSPVDWSMAESLAIPEPRCAIVNFTGLKSMPTSKTADIKAVMEFWDVQGNYFKKPIVCSAQGSSSLGYVKKNVKFDLLNDDESEFDLKIGNWVVQDGFHLKAYYTDFFRGVAVTSYKLWDEIMETRPCKSALVNTAGMNTTANGVGNVSDLNLQFDTGALCHPDGFPCIVYLNGEFYGVYSWQIKKQRKNYHLDKSTVEHIHLDGTLSTGNFWNGTINWTQFEIRNPNKLYTMDGKKYDGDTPRELIDETSNKFDPSNKDHVRSANVKKYIQSLVLNFGVLKQLYTAYRANPTEETLATVKAKYEELFDWGNQRDYLIFSDVIKNSDGFAKNWQWTTYDGKKWFVNAYDLDMSFGGHWQGIQITTPLTGHITTSTALPVYYVALLYKDELEARYKELREAGIIDVSHIVSKLEDWTARIGVSNYEAEYERWPNSPCINNYRDSIYRVRKWLQVEIANMDKVYNYSSFSTETEDLAYLDNDKGLARQTRELAEGLIRSELNSLDRENRMKSEIQHEVQTRAENEAGILEQLNSLAGAELQDIVNTLKALARHKAQITQEAQTRLEQDDGLQVQINELAMASLQNMMNDMKTRERVAAEVEKIKQLGKDFEESRQSIVSMGNIISSLDNIYRAILLNNTHNTASDDEIDEMLDEIF